MTKSPKIGLALGGGGARGLAHIPALEAFDELGIEPAHISGTSIGAIIGAAYAAGMSGADIRAHTVDMLADRGRALGQLMKLRPKRFKDLFEPGAFSLLQFDPEKVLNIFLPERIGNDFSSLRIPLSVIATDYYGWREVELSSGPLRRAVAASIALPTIFRPVQIDGQVLMDGGMVNPLPLDKVAACDIVVAIDVVGGPEQREGRTLPRAMDAVFGASQILMKSIIAEKLRHDRADILLTPQINQFKVLDFLKTTTVLSAAEPLKDELKRALDTALTAWRKKNP